jgi:hypothetical protein
MIKTELREVLKNIMLNCKNYKVGVKLEASKTF